MDGGLSWRDNETPVRTNLYAVQMIGKNEAVAVGDLGAVLLTFDGGRTWFVQQNLTGKQLNAVDYRGSRAVWVAGRGGTILKRVEPFSPTGITSPRLPPVLRSPFGGDRPKLKPRTPLITIPDDGDIPSAVKPKKDN
jgi:photosystem II stability/assembly factor-like uncharacterized protein